MQKAKTTNPTKETDERVKKDWGGGGCPVWIFGDEDSAKNDLDGVLEVVDNETKD